MKIDFKVTQILATKKCYFFINGKRVGEMTFRINELICITNGYPVHNYRMSLTDKHIKYHFYYERA